MTVVKQKIGGRRALTIWLDADGQPAEEDEGVLLKVVYPNGKTRFLVPERKEVEDWNPFQPRVPKGETGGGQWAGENLTIHERNAIAGYTHIDHALINHELRFEDQLTARTANNVKNLDSALAKSISDRNLTLYRGIGKGVEDFIGTLDTLRPGDKVVDRAFVSTSHDLLLASLHGNQNTVMEINVPSGSHVVYVESMTMNRGENEYILPRGTAVSFTGKRKAGSQNIYSFDLVS